MSNINKNKKAISNIEMIIAITLFIFSVVTVIYLLSITEPKADQSYSLDLLENKIRDYAEIDYELLVMQIDGGESCFVIPLSDLPDEFSYYPKKNISIFSNDGLINFDIDINNNGDLLLENLEDSDTYYIYFFSKEVTKENRAVVLCTAPDNYDLSIFYNGTIFSEKLFNKVADNYDRDYGDLKSNFGLSSDFAITVIYEENIISISKENRPEVEVLAREISTKMMLENGEIVDVVINLQVW